MTFAQGDVMLLEAHPDNVWAGAKVIITEVYDYEKDIVARLVGETYYKFEILDKSLPQFDADKDDEGNDFPPENAWRGIAFNHELKPLL